jgi:hypothetical protein
MNLEAFYNQITALLPVKRNNVDFRTDLEQTLNIYLHFVKNLDDDVKYNIKTWDENFKHIETFIEQIKDCVKIYYEGQYSSSFTILKNELLGYSTIIGIFECIDFFEVKTEDVFFRARSFDNNRNREYKDMFHIPLEKRGIVKTQRYSFPGYPCLYLGTTIYACWEELQRPKFDDLMFSAIKAQKEFKLIDLRIPSKEVLMDKTNFHKVLLLLPLIISCSFIVKEPNDTFKPEYIIPQLLIENIIHINNAKSKKKLDELILGVIYTSTHINNDFGFSNSVFDNLAIPILDVTNSYGFCNILSEYFTITKPTCCEYEEMRDQARIYWDFDPKQYSMSKMGYLEDKIKTFPYHKVK